MGQRGRVAPGGTSEGGGISEKMLKFSLKWHNLRLKR